MFQIKRDDFSIREFCLSDYKVLLKIADAINQQAQTHSGYQSFYAFQASKEQVDYNDFLQKHTKDFLLKALNEKNTIPRKTHRMALCDGKNNLIGNITVDMIPSTDETGNLIYGDIGYFIDPKHGRKGLMSKALTYVLGIYFQYYDTMDVTVHPNNLYSIKMLQRFNAKVVDFKKESIYNQEPRMVLKIQKSDFEISQNPIYVTTQNPMKRKSERGRIKNV